MSHVREGEIHAYLDGALDRLGEDRAAEVRRHVDGCEDCRARLEEERRVRDVAGQLLDSSAPGSFDMPPFEEILRRAEAGRGSANSVLTPGAGDGPKGKGAGARRTLRLTQRWAWAASLVVALGTGWLLRGSDLARTGRSDSSDAMMAMESQSRPEAEVADRESDDVGGESVVDEVEDRRDAAEQMERLELAAAPAESTQRSGPLLRRTAQPRAVEPVVVGAVGQSSAGAAGSRDQVAVVALADSVTASGADQVVQGRTPSAELSQTEREENAPSRLNEDAAAEGPALELAPGLPVIEATGDSSNVRIVQLLPEGDLLLLEFIGVEGAIALLERPAPEAANEAADAPLARARTATLRRVDADTSSPGDEQFTSEVRLSRGAGLVVVRSSRPQAELEALLRSWGMLRP